MRSSFLTEKLQASERVRFEEVERGERERALPKKREATATSPPSVLLE